MITQEVLKDISQYDEHSGLFTWKIKPTNSVNIGDIAGTIDSDGYILIGFDNVSYKAHRLVFLWVWGNIPEYVDHIDGVRSNNRWCNLRSTTKGGNSRNQKISIRNTSGIKGVNWKSSAGKWRAYVAVNGVQQHLGYFEDKYEAEKVVKKKREELHGEYCNHG